VKTDVRQVDLVLRLSDGTSEKNQIPKRAGTTDKSISTGIKYWVCCIKSTIKYGRQGQFLFLIGYCLKKASLKLLGKMEPNLAGSIYESPNLA
jgi:hypothetical protein